MERERQIILDNRFRNGFAVKPQTDGDNEIIGYLACGPAKERPSMVLAQWYCGFWNADDKEEYARHNILNGYRRCDGDNFEWGDASKRLRLDSKSGCLELELDASKEYKNSRRRGEPWPHILVEYETLPAKLCALRSAVLDMEFCLKKLNCRMADTDASLHTAQFVWYAIVKNVNASKRDFGKYIWFGCTLYDSRYEQLPRTAVMDGGKEINTGTLIYQPASCEYLPSRPAVGQKQKIHFETTEHLRLAFEEARARSLFSDTAWEDLAITGGNFGWEITGTYDVCMEIEKMELNVQYQNQKGGDQ